MLENVLSKSTNPWHALPGEEVLNQLESRLEGISEEEVKERLKTFGLNRLRTTKKRGPWFLFLSQFKNVLIYVLLLAACITAIIGHWVDAGIIAGVVVINALIGFIQEGKAEKALEAIQDLLSAQATVIRLGKRVSIPAEELVPGDVVFIESGDKVPADLRLISIRNLHIDESSLTGESVPVEKSLFPVQEKAGIGDRTCLAFSGTLVTYGQAQGVVVNTGDRAEIGRISALIALAPPMTTRLLKKMAEFNLKLTLAIGILAAITFLFGIIIRDYGLTEMFLAAVGLAVAAIPEGLPAILTITLAIGVRRMAGWNAIVRRLASVETLGSVTVICSDKTGTLTRNEMTVKSVSTATGLFEVSGVGYTPQGTLTLQGAEFSCRLLDGERLECSQYPDLQETARTALLCNEASLYEKSGKWQLQGDPTEGALLSFGMKAGLDQDAENQQWVRMDIIPFESEHRFMATLNHNREGRARILVKGAPERILDMCSSQWTAGQEQPLDRDFWQTRIAHVAGLGERPLALALKETRADHESLQVEDVRTGLTLLGIVGIIDPPRGEAINAIEKCKSAGIRVKMITGDHILTARAIGVQMGIGDGVTALSGEELEEISDGKLGELVNDVDVFARVSPEHKLRLVQALQTRGEVVAMTGDGVNDAPALKRADIGVAMGIKGTAAAREAAEMVLADDNFASIEHAVEEGRTVYDNIKKAIMFILPTNAGEAGIIVAAILFGRLLPITPVQILWINMITAVTLALSLAFEPPEQGVMKRPPRHPQEGIITTFLLWRVGFVSLILVLGTFGLFLVERVLGSSIETARTTAVNTLVMFEIFYLFSTRYLRDTVFTREGIFGNSYTIAASALVIILQMVFTYTSLMQNLFGTEGISIASWLRVILVAACVLVLVETEKLVLRKRLEKNA